MTILCLENYGVSNLETWEMKTTDGGFLGPVAAAFGIIGAIAFAAGYAYEKLR